MSRFLGALELGLNVNWRYAFVGYGTKAEPMTDVLYLDVGGSLQRGVVDHHGGDHPASSTADLVFNHREAAYGHLLEPWLVRKAEGRLVPGTAWSPTVVTHIFPDWDSVAGAWLVRKLIEFGDFPPAADGLVNYTRRVDQGRVETRPGVLDAAKAPHVAYLAISNLAAPPPKGISAFQWHLEQGFQLIDRVVDDLSRSGKLFLKAEQFERAHEVADGWWTDSRFSDAWALLQHEDEKFARDKAEGTQIARSLPAEDGEDPIEVKGFISPRPTESVLNKYWIRAEGFPFFVCPYDRRGDTSRSLKDVYPRVVISLDPNWKTPDNRRPSLRGLGFRLEEAEASARKGANGGIDDRGGDPRFPHGYCENADPWYDGRAHDFTIVDAPNAESRLPFGVIKRIATEDRFWEVPVTSALVSLVWIGDFDRKPGVGVRPGALAKFDGIARPLEPLFEDSTEEEWSLGQVETFIVRKKPFEQLNVACRAFTRRFPAGTAPPLTIFRIEPREHSSGASLEGLVEARKEVAKAVARALSPKGEHSAPSAPDYIFARVRLGKHFSGDALVDRLLRELSDTTLERREGFAGGAEVLLLGGRSIIFHDEGPASTASGIRAADPDLEMLLYAAFLGESLVSFSDRISKLVPAGEKALDEMDAATLRRDVLKFQARYFQFEITRLPRGRKLFDEIARSFQLLEHYAEVLSEVDRLTEVEEHFAEARRQKAERGIQRVLYWVAVFGVIQTITALVALDPKWQKSVPFWGGVAACIAVAFGLWRKSHGSDRTKRKAVDRCR